VLIVARLLIASLALAALTMSRPTLAAKCEIGKHADMAITMNGFRPIVLLQINGKDAHFLLDSGAYYSMMSPAVAAQFRLRTTNTPFGMRVTGVGGSSMTEATVVKELKFAEGAVANVEFLVGGSEVGADGLLGQNLLKSFDVEYDFGHGAVRLFTTDHCDDTRMSYWLSVDQIPSVMALDLANEDNPRTLGSAYVNGHKISVQFDSGAMYSVMTAEAAARVGVTPASPGVVEGGASRGIGSSMVKNYIATFSTFSIGDHEEIKNARLRFAKLELNHVDMLIGADFFISHRIFVATKERKIFISYNGGPVFNLTRVHSAEEQPSGPVESDASDAETDPVEAARKGSALVARGEFPLGLALLSRAVELSPGNPEYYFQRANGLQASGQDDRALADLDQVIKLKADFLPAYLPIARLHIKNGNKSAALAELEAVDQLAPPQADLRFGIGSAFAQLDLFAQAITQYTIWADNHPNENRVPGALLLRCASRAMLNQDLPAALNDCNVAARRFDKTDASYAAVLADRALVRTRMGENDRAIEDCDAALKLDPKNAAALYLRGIARTKKGNGTEGEKDIALSKEKDPKLAERYAKFGIAP
jgi:tetratricopeptide (TPR) repeat protein/predicted aspartyl protease